MKQTITIFLTGMLLVPFVLSGSEVAKAYNELPDVMVGDMTVNFNAGDGRTTIYYDGLGGNETVVNFSDPPEEGFNKTSLYACAGQPLIPSPPCFLHMGSTAVRLLTSRTFRSGTIQTETAAIAFSPNIIQGDAYSDFDSDNFAYLGRNLNQNLGAKSPSNGSWNTGSYTFNSEAQSSFTGKQAQYIKNRVIALANEAKEITNISSLNGSDWYLQGSTILDSSNSDASNYPEGKVWIVKGDLTLTDAILTRKYHGKGTIIFMKDTSNPNLVLGRRVQVVPGNKDTDSLGIIIGKRSGDSIADASAKLEFQGINTLSAATLVFGQIQKSSSGSIDAIGSFVANSFDGFTATNGFTRFVYDYKLEQNWPPGFRYFDMPQSLNSSAN